MAHPRSSQGHLLVVVLVGLTAAAHAALLAVPGDRPGWFRVVTTLLALAAFALVVAGVSVVGARFGGAAEDRWLVACAAVGALGVMSGFGLALVSLSGGSPGGVDPWGIGVLLVDALTVRLAVFTLRRVPPAVAPAVPHSRRPR